MTIQQRKKRPNPTSIRLNENERASLEQRAGGLPLSTYVKNILFADGVAVVRRSPRAVSGDRDLLARVLAAFGASRIASNLSQIAKHANLGNLYFDDETKADIKEACVHVREIRALLMAALGKEAGGASSPEPLSPKFESAASAQRGGA